MSHLKRPGLLSPEEETATSTRKIGRVAEENDLDYRGVYHIPSQSKVLFSEEIEIKTEELPRWQPKITIEPRMLEDEDD